MEFDQGNPRRGAGNRLSRASGQPELWRESILEEEVIPYKICYFRAIGFLVPVPASLRVLHLEAGGVQR